jgi:CheY-like chemotaxis protein
MIFPLLRLPLRVVHVDDDEEHLAMYRMQAQHMGVSDGGQSLPAAEYIHSASNALSALGLEASHWEAVEEGLSTAVVSREDSGGDAAAVVQHHFRDWRRFRVSTVVVLDYKMPGLTGLDVLREAGPSQACKVLLTGQADEGLGFKAYQDQLIDRFVGKSTPDLIGTIQRSYLEMHELACARLSLLVRPLLSGAQEQLLQTPAVAAGLRRTLRELQWIEYVVIGKPFGLLGATATGPLQWLQLETPESARELGNMASDDGYTTAQAREIAEGSAIAMDEVLSQLRVKVCQRLVPSQTICEAPQTFSGTMDLPVEIFTRDHYGLDDIFSVSDLMKAQLRNMRAALECTARFGASKSSYEQAVADFAAIAVTKARFRAAAQDALSSADLPSVCLSDFQTAIENATCKR